MTTASLRAKKWLMAGVWAVLTAGLGTLAACGGAAPAATSGAGTKLPDPQAAQELAITTTTLSPAESGTGYTASLAATGGTAPETWTLKSGQLPAGVTLNSNGTFSGTPAADGNFAITVQVTDSSTPAQTASANLTLIVTDSAMSLSTPWLYRAFQGAVYTAGDDADLGCCSGNPGGALVEISGGTGPYSCTAAAGSLPPGMSLSGVTPPIYPAGLCELTGTPTAAGEFPMTIEVQDSAGNLAAQTLTFTVMSGSPPTISAGPTAVPVSPTAEQISWTTNALAASKVCYSIGNAIDTCTPEADLGGATSHVVTLSGLVPSDTIQYFVESRGVSGGAPQDYLTVVSPVLSFVTPAPMAAAYPIIMASGAGAHDVVQGYPLYVGVAIVPTQDATGNAGVSFTVSSLPPHTQVHWPDQQDDNLGQGVVSSTDTTNDTLTLSGLGGNNTTQFDLLTNQGGTTTPGNYTLTVSYGVSAGGVTVSSGSFNWAVTVEASAGFTATPPAAYPPIPDLATWQAQMIGTGVPEETDWYNGEVRGGGCDSAGDDEGIAYYDGAWVYDQIGAYTGNLSYWTAGAGTSPCPSSDNGHGPQGAAASAYLYHQYIAANNYYVPGYWNFPHGLYYACTVQGSAQGCTDLHGMANGTLGMLTANNGARFDAVNVRETSYALGLRRLDYDAGGSTTLAQVQALADYALGDVDQIVNGTTGFEEPFMDGLLAQALIEYYMDPKTGNQADARIPGAMEALANHLWATDWVPRAGNDGLFIYNRIEDGNGTESNPPGGSDSRNLNLMIAPLYAWLYRETGKTLYQQEGDVIWDSGVTTYAGNGIGWSGKNFSQQYRWSLEFAKWRGAAGTYLNPW